MSRITIDGKPLKQVAEETGISYQTLKARYEIGLPLEQVLNPLDLREANAFLLEIDGHKGTINQWSRATGISYHSIYGRVRKGFTGREAVYGKYGVTL